MNKLLACLVFLFSLSLFGCKVSQEVSDKRIINDDLLVSPSSIRGTFSKVPGALAVIKIYYSTNRNLTAEKIPTKWLGTERSNLKYGICYVNIPRDHRMGELERPSIWRLDLNEDTAKHVVLRKVVIQPRGKYFEEVKKDIRADLKKEAFVFVHGYNVSFADAALITAQLSYDLSFNGIPVFYSWPSRGTYIGYTADEATIEWAQIHLKKFLTEFIEQSGVERVHLIAHGMGSRALTRALTSLLEKNNGLKERVSEIILAAPDIDVDVFKDDIAPALTKSSSHITLYGSATDKALLASKELHGGINRVGDTEEKIFVISGIDTIDATNVNSSFIGHSLFNESRSVMSDIFSIIRNHQNPDDRPGLQRVNEKGALYWKFVK